MSVRWLVARDTAIVVILLLLATAGSLVLAWVTDIAPSQQTVTRTVAALILGGCGLLLCLFVVLVAVLRADHYAGRPRSPLHLPLIVSVGALLTYFGIASISALDVYYEPGVTWPLLRDPGAKLVATALVAGIVTGPAWMLVEILRGRGLRDRRIAALYAVGVVLTALVIAVAVTVGGQT